MLLTLGNTPMKLIGDPHLGKKFVEGVAPHRRGEREKEQMEHFRRELNTPGVDMNVMMGDIFDSFLVSVDILVETFSAYLTAAMLHPEVIFVLVRGNHDVSRDAERFSSFDILREMLAQLPNVIVVEDAQVITSKSGDKFLFFGYSAFTSATDMVVGMFADGKVSGGDRFVAAFGHWDADSFGNDFNLAPVEALKHLTDVAYSGHVHTPYERMIGDFKLVGTGSMQPYTFAEDPSGEIYVTDTLDNVEKNLQADPNFYANRCLRVLLEPGQVPPAVECRQLSVKTSAVTEEIQEVRSEQFELAVVFRDHFVELGLPSEEVAALWNEYQGVERDVQDA